MFDYTKIALKETVEKFKRADYVRNVVTQLLYIAYLIYALFAPLGFLWANVVLLTASLAYFGFFIYATKIKTEKTLKKRVRAAFKRCKQLVKLLTLGITVYSAFTTANHVTPLSLFFLAFLITAFVLQILFDVILSIFVGRIHFLWDAVEADIQELKKPVTSVGNFFKKLTGKEVETPTPNKNQLYLEEKVIQEKERKRAEKRAKKGWRWFARKDPAPTQDDTTDTED